MAHEPANVHLSSLAADILRQAGLRVEPVTLPAVPPDITAFRGRQMLLLDDSEDILLAFIPALVAATGGSVQCMRHRGEDAGDVAADIAGCVPEIALIDGELGGGVRGTEIVKELADLAPDIRCIGFSSAASRRDAFLEAGAAGFAWKDPDNVWDSLRRVAECVQDM